MSVLNLLKIISTSFNCNFIFSGLIKKSLTFLKILLALQFDCSNSGINSFLAAILIILANFTLANNFIIR